MNRQRLLACALAVAAAAAARAQFRGEPGKPIGSVAVRGNLIVMTLDENVLGKASLFDLAHRTLRFTPEAPGYRVESGPLRWDPEFGGELSGAQASLKNFAFPFSGKTWSAFSVGISGSVTFGDAGGGRGGLSVDRFAELRVAGRTVVNTIPAISVFFKPRMSGKRYLKELADRVVLTWSITEPFGGIQDMTWTPTVNRFQAVLHQDGAIEMSYEDVAAQDAIVGVYPVVNSGAERELATLPGEAGAAVRSVKLSTVDGLFLKAIIETGAPVDGATPYLLCLNSKRPAGDCRPDSPADAVWPVQGGRGGRGGAAPSVKVEGSSVSVQGLLPRGYRAGDSIFVSLSAGNVAQVRPVAVKLAGIASPEVDLSAAKKSDGPLPIVYEAFHYLRPPRAVDLTCTVIKALGDRFDLLAYYSDFRIDNPEAGTSSNGPLGGGPAGGAVAGIGAMQRNLASYCTEGRFQWQYIQPVYAGSNQMQEYPPAGHTDPSARNIASYLHQLAERTSTGKIPPYNYAMSQLGHEMGHRWSAFVSAKIGGERIPLGPTHWARGLHAPVAFPYQRPVEASLMGGSVWQDNFDGTYTQLDDDYYVPATGWSYLDLYLMGLIAPAEVPDFFLLRNLTAAGRDTAGRPIVKADRTKVTIQDVIAAEGPRLPDVDHAQKNFNTGMVVVVEHGKTPSRELIEGAEGIRLRWIDFWETTTGHRSTMTANPR
jgi:hypothetical protein